MTRCAVGGLADAAAGSDAPPTNQFTRRQPRTTVFAVGIVVLQLHELRNRLRPNELSRSVFAQVQVSFLALLGRAGPEGIDPQGCMECCATRPLPTRPEVPPSRSRGARSLLRPLSERLPRPGQNQAGAEPSVGYEVRSVGFRGVSLGAPPVSVAGALVKGGAVKPSLKGGGEAS
jgi:hypothetical protein